MATIMLMKDLILIKRGYLLSPSTQSKRNAYYVAKLLNTFGVLVDKPDQVTQEHVKLISKFYGVKVPESFYSNPQDLKNFTCDELFLEKIISYIKIEYFTGIKSKKEKDFERVEIFQKILPNYKEGEEVVFRNYSIVSEEEADIILEQVVEDFCTYTRKWSESESEEFRFLYESGYYKKQNISSKDNAIELFIKYQKESFAKSLDQKDVVKISVETLGDVPKLKANSAQKNLLLMAIKNCKKTILTKKQSKYYNALAKFLVTEERTNSKNSPYRLAKIKIDSGDIVGAALIFSKHGSLLQRNLIWLLSRAKSEDFNKIIDLIEIKNPIIFIQLIFGLLNEGSYRVFGFYKDRKIVKHKETEYEAKWRKSKLTLEQRNLVLEIALTKVHAYYSQLPKIGKVFVSPEFLKIALPLNTSASGSGLDVLPCGSRVKLTEENIRFFCYWKGIYDIDTNMVVFDKNLKKIWISYWGNYDQKIFGDALLGSGDDRSNNGAEYTDVVIDKLVNVGVKYLVYCLNGYQGNFNKGEIYCGYQNKSNLETKVWSPKNIAMKITIKGDSSSYMAFGVDLISKEIIILNQIIASNKQVIDESYLTPVLKYFNEDTLKKLNVYSIMTTRGQVVTEPSEADVVFDSEYVPTENQKVVRPNDIEKLVALLT